MNVRAPVLRQKRSAQAPMTELTKPAAVNWTLLEKTLKEKWAQEQNTDIAVSAYNKDA